MREREKIAKEHENYHRGLLHFLATDPRVPEKVREDMQRFGLPRDEFTDNGGWPHQIYVREARRMVSDLVLTEHHTFGRQVAPKSVGLGCYGTDTHEIRRIVKDGVVIREGKTAGGRDGCAAVPDRLRRHRAEGGASARTLFVTFALSASHTAFSSIRMEPVFMVTSQSAATAACMAIDERVPVQQVDYARLQVATAGRWPGAGVEPSPDEVIMLRLPLLFSCLAASSGLLPAAKPNVLFIAIDDLSNALGCYGAVEARTPHLDRLAASGVRFDGAYNQIPLCNPSRASVLTGRRPDATQVYDLDRHFRAALPEATTLPQLFRQNGWFTARVGKIFHYDVPKDIGMDGLDDGPSWDLVINPKGRDVAEEARIINPTPGKPVSAALSWLAAEGTDEEQTDGLIAGEAIKLMERRIQGPFFIGVGFFRPHTPYVAPKTYFDMHPLETVRLPKAPPDDRDDMPVAAFAHNNPVPHYGLDELTCRRALQAYRASVSFVDAQVGRLLDALDRLGLADRTIVLLWSDHGYHLGEHRGIWQKRTLFEQSARAPLIIRAPSAAGNGRACRRVVEFVDILPTLADLASLTPPEPLDGRSLRPLLEDPSLAWNRTAITQILRPADDRLPQPVMGRSIRDERWRYTEWNGGAAGLELYDHESDPGEFHNRALNPDAEAAAAMKRLRAGFRDRAIARPPASPVNPKRL